MTGYQSKKAAARDKLNDDDDTQVYQQAQLAQVKVEGPLHVVCQCDKCKAQPAQERTFCPRCGKRTADLTVIHTCTPPQEDT